MRITDIKEKKQEEVEIPNRLVSFFKDILPDILNKEEYTQIAEGDLIQCDYAYGGPIENYSDIYSFTYFRTYSAARLRALEFSVDQLEDICEGKIKTTTLWACTQENCQSKFVKKDTTCFYHDYFDDGEPYPGQLSSEEIEKLQRQKLEMLKKWRKEHQESENIE